MCYYKCVDNDTQRGEYMKNDKNNPHTVEGEGMEMKLPLSIDEKAMLMHDIVNFLADKGCTIEDAEDILNGTMRSIRSTSKVDKLKW